MADQTPARPNPTGGETPVSTGQGDASAPATDAITQIAAVARKIAQLGSTAIVAPPVTEPPTETKTPLPTDTSALALARPGNTSAPIKGGGTPAKATKRPAKDKIAEKSDKRSAVSPHRERFAAATAKPMVVRPVGKSETGTAAWYGGRYVGRRTSSGERLDAVHATAAHRSLPLNSLARVTDLRSGRSVIVRVTDRGPLDDSLLIDMSPRAADELRMKQAGLIPVRVEQVVEVPPELK